MKDLVDITTLVTTAKLASWEGILEFLSHSRFKKEPPKTVQITKDGKEWTIEANSSLPTPSSNKITTKSRGVGLFDLNW